VARITYKGKAACSGSVIGDGWVLTAYHCRFAGDKELDYTKFRVQVWKNGTVGSGPVYKSRLSERPISRPHSSLGLSDVALLHMASPMPTWVKTIPMALDTPAIGTALVQYGYGWTTGSGSPARTLQKTPDGDLKRVDCNVVYPEVDWTIGNFCAEGTRSSAWEGDSGGPLLQWVNGSWQQVASFSLYPQHPDLVHWQEYWSEADTETREWIRSFVTGDIATGTILRDPVSAKMWVFGSDGYRHRISDSSTLACLDSSDHGLVLSWPLRRIETIPEMKGKSGRAQCTAGTGTSNKLDLVFVIDTTGSMSPYIASTVDSASDIVETLDGSGLDYQVGVVDYKDADDCDDYDAVTDLEFTKNKGAIESALADLEGKVVLGAGCDTPEDVYSGIERALDFPWRDGAHKVVIQMGDAPGKDPEPHSGLTLAKITQHALAVDPAIVDTIMVGSDEEAHQFDQALSDATGGHSFDASGDPSEVGDAIIDAIKSETGGSSKPALEVSPNVVRRGGSVQVHAQGLAAGEDCVLVYLGKKHHVTADGSGVVNVDLKIPATAPTGANVVTLMGTRPAIVLSTTFKVRRAAAIG
jgi:hypothetical protein